MSDGDKVVVMCDPVSVGGWWAGCFCLVARLE
jgi:hypothetical protein